ncbi:FAD-dependent oxidoreductase [Aeromicrobium sp. UC242_57]
MGPTPADLSDDAVTAELMEFITGPVDADYLPLAAHELGSPRDTGAPAWKATEVAPDRSFRVVIVGAGMSGLVAAHRLRATGVCVTVLEKNDDIGGTWLENTYPGCRLDTSNFGYSLFVRPSDRLALPVLVA